MKMETTTIASTFGRLPSSDKNGGIGNGRRQWTKKTTEAVAAAMAMMYLGRRTRKKNEEEDEENLQLIRFLLILFVMTGNYGVSLCPPLPPPQA